jgi:CubicO group peptidase (beta-lactamase class C family)
MSTGTILSRLRYALGMIIFALALHATFSIASSADAAEEGGEVSAALVPLPAQKAGVAWPTRAWPEAAPSADVDPEALASAADTLFSPIGRSAVPDTRALVVVQQGRIVFERYAEGFGIGSRFHTWSLAKSFTNALVGILVRDGVFSLDQAAPIPEWQAEDDPRRAITIRQLLNMTSGIDNGDMSGGRPSTGGFAGELLFGTGASNPGAFSADRPLIHPPGTHWAYSTATSTLVARMVGAAVAPDPTGRNAFIHKALLDRIGASETIFEFDATGHFLGGSHIYATARDFARFGLLYLRDGIWDQQRILPEGWVDFSRTRAPAANNGNHAAHFWINHVPKPDQFVLFPGAPESVFEASGNNGQIVTIVPTHDLLVVRLGEMQTTNWSELNGALADLINVFPENEASAP